MVAMPRAARREKEGRCRAVHNDGRSQIEPKVVETLDADRVARERRRLADRHESGCGRERLEELRSIAAFLGLALRKVIGRDEPPVTALAGARVIPEACALQFAKVTVPSAELNLVLKP